MRLIDADALLKNAKRAVYTDDLGTTTIAVNIRKSHIEKMPTIDAIPVEWLKQQFYDNPKSQWAEKCRDVYTKWQKEQEDEGCD